MILPDDTSVVSAEVEFLPRAFRVPMRLSSGLIETITEARATVVVRVNGREAAGRGAVYLSDLWAWPDPARSHAERDAALRDFCRHLAEALPALAGAPAHPLELGLRLHHRALEPAGHIPPLARALCVSPFDAAIHDAAGRALECSAFDFYDAACRIPSADPWFSDGAVAAVRRLLRPPVEHLDGCWIVNAHDRLDETFIDALRHTGFRRIKVKLLGRDPGEDARLAAAVFRVADAAGIRVRLTLDSNEGHADAEAVRVFLVRLAAEDAGAFAAVDYLEQPTGRDIAAQAFDWRECAAIKPVLMDEGLTSLDRLPMAVRQGWSGLALKTCKGHSFILTVAAWARRNGLLLTMQDLTNPGLAAIHSWLVAARLPLLGGIELNSPQFTPDANREWLPRLDGLFAPRDGKHRLTSRPVGLGSAL